MTKQTKVYLAIASIIISAIAMIGINGYYLMAIEKHYGSNQRFYYKTHQGDIVVNHELNQVQEVKKSWNRIFFVHGHDTLDLLKWIDHYKIEIYRPSQSIANINILSTKDLDEMLANKQIKLVIKN